MNFTNKVALITGGATGIGAATALKLAEAGAKVYVLDINRTPLNKTIEFIECDVSDFSQVQKAVNHVIKKENKIDLMFLNAGIHLSQNLENTSLEDFEKVLSVNLKGIFYVLKLSLPTMKKQKTGNIVLMGSDQCFIGKKNSFAYGLTKGAIGQITKSTALDCAKFGIRINCVCPGTIKTPLYDNAVKNYANKTGVEIDTIHQEENNVIPLGRIGRPEDIANLVLFLLSDSSSFMTGSLVSIDGGYTAQ
jgi:NAD(P)-dependent dehydrogenase (short-subunit alcohol dehydrogenase family)